MEKKDIKISIYDEFSCLAGKCELTCCQAWNIAVDSETKATWKEILGDEEVENNVENVDGVDVIKLNEDGKCPFLNDEKLCKLVCKHGEEALSDSCDVYPRQIREYEDRFEYSLVASCPAVCDLLYKKDTCEIAITEYNSSEEEPKVTKNQMMYKVREMLIKILKEPTYSLSKALKIAFFYLLNVYEATGRGENLVEIADLEMDAFAEISEALDEAEGGMLDTFDEGMSIFIDFVSNYVAEGKYADYLTDKYEAAVELMAGYNEDDIYDELDLFFEQFAPYDEFLRRYVVNAVFADFIEPETNIEDAILQYQWLLMKYAAIKQAAFSDWYLSVKSKIDYEDVRNAVCHIERLTGYDIDDIRDYFEECYDMIIWDFNYVDVIVG